MTKAKTFMSPPPFEGSYDKKATVWFLYEHDIADWADQHSHMAETKVWNTDNDGSLKIIDHNMIGKTISGVRWVMPEPEYISMQFDDKKDKLLMVLVMMLNAGEIAAP